MNVLDWVIVVVLVPALAVMAWVVGVTVVEMLSPMPPDPPHDMGPR